jgi:hypothetical protein
VHLCYLLIEGLVLVLLFCLDWLDLTPIMKTLDAAFTG